MWTEREQYLVIKEQHAKNKHALEEQQHALG